MSVERSGQVERVLVFSLWEVRPLEELRGQDHLRPIGGSVAYQRLHTRDILFARAAEGALDDADR